MGVYVKTYFQGGFSTFHKNIDSICVVLVNDGSK